MKKKVLIVYIILIFIVIKLTSTFFINESFISKYNKGNYDKNQVKKLFFLNIIQPYIAHYNYGNVLYKNSDFDGAIEEYNKSLKLFPSEEKECSIRINLALAMLAKLDEKESVEEKIEILNDAKAKLCEDDCKNENVQQLKSDIDKMLEELNKSENSEEQENKDKKTDEKENENQEKQEVDKIKQQLEQFQKEAGSVRQDDLDYIRSVSYEEYYSGKRW